MAQEWARRSNAVQSAKRMAREPDFETLRWRALDGARGRAVLERQKNNLSERLTELISVTAECEELKLP